MRWTRFHHTHVVHSLRESSLLQQLPVAIQRDLVDCIFGDTLNRVPFFDMLSHVDKDFLRYATCDISCDISHVSFC